MAVRLPRLRFSIRGDVVGAPELRNGRLPDRGRRRRLAGGRAGQGGADVDDRSRVAYATLVGAALGGLVGFLFFTARGQRVRGEIGPRLTDVVDEAKRLQGVAGKLREAMHGGWESIAAFLSELSDRRAAWRDEAPGSREGRRLH